MAKNQARFTNFFFFISFVSKQKRLLFDCRAISSCLYNKIWFAHWIRITTQQKTVFLSVNSQAKNTAMLDTCLHSIENVKKTAEKLFAEQKRIPNQTNKTTQNINEIKYREEKNNSNSRKTETTKIKAANQRTMEQSCIYMTVRWWGGGKWGGRQHWQNSKRILTNTRKINTKCATVFSLVCK